ncbi:ISL3 family transposase [Nitriliruptoraceae bacterium ZYF776]|nr:ISL3 family transposase [Profundirhabdus halotolerans]
MSQPTPVEGWSELLLALPEFILTDALIDDHDELVAHVELPREVQACIRCGVVDRHRVHDRRSHTVRHLPVAGRATRLVWHKRLLACVEGCGTFMERTASIAPGAVWSRAAARAAVAASAANVPIDTIRKSFGVGWNTVMRAVAAAAELVAPVNPKRVGIDETVMVTGRLTTRRRQFLTALVCLDTSLVVAVAQGRDRGSASRLLADHAPDAQVVACDLFSGFKSAAETLEHAVVVADVFHLVKLSLQVLDEVRRLRQQQIHGHRGHKNDPLFKLRRVLRVAQERLDEHVVAKTFDRLREADTDDEVAAAWVAVDLLRHVYAAPDRDSAHRRLIAFYEWVVQVEVAEVTRLARTIDTWQDEVLAFFDTRASNGPTESANVKIKNVRRAARGFRNTDNYRARILLHAGQPRRVPTTTRIRPYSFAAAA